MKVSKIAIAVAGVFGSFMQRTGLALNAMALSLEKAERDKLPKDVQALYVEKDGKFVLDLPEGVEEVGGLKSALDKERKAAKELDKKLKEMGDKFKDIDPELYRRITEHFDNAEEAELLKKGAEGVKAIIERRTEKMRKDFEKLVADEKKKTESAFSRSKKFETQVLDNHVRAAATKAGVHQHAVEDALIRARAVFSLNEDGDVVQLNNGEVVLGKDGKTPFHPTEWMEGMKEQAPHWFPASNTGGGSGGGGKGGGNKTMKRAAFDSLGVTEKATAAKEMREGKLQIVD